MYLFIFLIVLPILLFIGGLLEAPWVPTKKNDFYRKVKILFGNFYRHNVSRADVVYIFLMPKTFDKLERKLNEELRESSKVIISCWPLKNFTPLTTSEEDNEITYYLYNKAALLSQGS